MGGVVDMSELVQELDMLKRRAVTARRTRQRSPLTSKQRQSFACIFKTAEIELKKFNANALVTDEFLETADDYEDELTAYELQGCVDSILSSVDLCVCRNSFVVPTDKTEEGIKK